MTKYNIGDSVRIIKRCSSSLCETESNNIPSSVATLIKEKTILYITKIYEEGNTNISTLYQLNNEFDVYGGEIQSAINNWNDILIK